MQNEIKQDMRLTEMKRQEAVGVCVFGGRAGGREPRDVRGNKEAFR